MPNEAEKFGLPQVIIDFRTKSTTAIARSARGIGVMILNNESTNVSKFYKISDSTDIPDEGLMAKTLISSRRRCSVSRCASWSTRCRWRTLYRVAGSRCSIRRTYSRSSTISSGTTSAIRQARRRIRKILLCGSRRSAISSARRSRRSWRISTRTTRALSISRRTTFVV